MATTYIALNSPIVWPGNTLNMNGAVPTTGNLDTLDSNGGPSGEADASAFIFCAPQDMTISHVFFRCNVATSSPTALVRIETVDANGHNSGTLWATNTNGTSSTLTTGMNTVALTASATITKGQIFALVIKWNAVGSFTPSLMAIGSSIPIQLPYKETNIGGTWAGRSGLTGTTIGFGSSSTNLYWVPGCYPCSAGLSQNSFNNTSSARRGARFQVPVDCYISGIRYFQGSATGDFKVTILDSSNNELGSSETSFVGLQAGNQASHGVNNHFFDNEVGPLTQATDYFVAITPTTSTNCNMYTWSLSTNNFRKAFPGGTSFDYAAGTPTMTADDTKIPLIDLLISRLPLGGSGPASGSGGGIIGM